MWPMHSRILQVPANKETNCLSPFPDMLSSISWRQSEICNFVHFKCFLKAVAKCVSTCCCNLFLNMLPPLRHLMPLALPVTAQWLVQWAQIFTPFRTRLFTAAAQNLTPDKSQVHQRPFAQSSPCRYVSVHVGKCYSWSLHLSYKDIQYHTISISTMTYYDYTKKYVNCTETPTKMK